MKNKKEKNRTEQSKKRDSKDRTKGMVVLPYVKGVSEGVSRILRKHQIATAMKPHKTLRSLLVHPKDKIKLQNKSDIVYSIPCKQCNKEYIGETGRNFKYRLEEH